MDYDWIPHPKNEDIIVMIHGWACQPSDFHLQINQFKHTHSLLLPSYSSLNVNDIPQGMNSLSWLAKQMLHAIKRHATHKVHIAGHSMGGVLALLIIAADPSLFNQYFFIDSSIILSERKKDRFSALGKSILHDNNILKDFIDNYMILTDIDNAQIMQKKKNEILKIHNESAQLLSRLMLDAATIELQQPLEKLNRGHYIAARTPLVSAELLDKRNKKISYHHIKNSGHFITLNAPDELNRIIIEAVK